MSMSFRKRDCELIEQLGIIGINCFFTLLYFFMCMHKNLSFSFLCVCLEQLDFDILLSPSILYPNKNPEPDCWITKYPACWILWNPARWFFVYLAVLDLLRTSNGADLINWHPGFLQNLALQFKLFVWLGWKKVKEWAKFNQILFGWI